MGSLASSLFTTSASGSANQIRSNPPKETRSPITTPIPGTAAAFRTVTTSTAMTANTKSEKTLSFVIAIFAHTLRARAPERLSDVE